MMHYIFEEAFGLYSITWSELLITDKLYYNVESTWLIRISTKYSYYWAADPRVKPHQAFYLGPRFLFAFIY